MGIYTLEVEGVNYELGTCRSNMFSLNNLLDENEQLAANVGRVSQSGNKVTVTFNFERELHCNEVGSSSSLQFNDAEVTRVGINFSYAS